jgi:threonine/homoserine/homoserine lactone efflux protein
MGTSVAVKAFVFGVTIAATIGPIALLIINVSAVDGLARGIRASLGAALADLVFATTAFAGGYAITAVLDAHRSELRAIASAVLVILGVWMAAQAWRSRSAGRSSGKRWLRAPFLQTFALTIVNPLGVIAFMSLAVQVPVVTSLAAMAFLCFCVFAGSLLVQLGLAVGGSLLARLTQHGGWLRALNLASGLGVAAFGVVGLVPNS